MALYDQCSSHSQVLDNNYDKFHANGVKINITLLCSDPEWDVEPVYVEISK